MGTSRQPKALRVSMGVNRNKKLRVYAGSGLGVQGVAAAVSRKRVVSMGGEGARGRHGMEAGKPGTSVLGGRR